eukprot:2029005-Rhodomonas_salina.2
MQTPKPDKATMMAQITKLQQEMKEQQLERQEQLARQAVNQQLAQKETAVMMAAQALLEGMATMQME